MAYMYAILAYLGSNNCTFSAPPAGIHILQAITLCHGAPPKATASNRQV